MPLPEWLMDNETDIGSIEPRRSWLTGSVNRLSSLTTARAGHAVPVRLDPRAALLICVALTVCATILRGLPAIALCWGISIAVALLLDAPGRAVTGATLVVGALTAATMIPAATRSLSPGPAVVHIAGIVFTSSGLRLLSVITLRVLSCLTFGIGLFASNRPEDLFLALRWFRVPGIFVLILLFAYRYIHLVLRAVLELHVARKSRGGDDNSLADARVWLGEQVGSVFARTAGLAEEVHSAMIARGFDGEWRAAPSERFRATDWTAMVLILALAASLVLTDRGIF